MTLIRLNGVTKAFPPTTKDGAAVVAVDDVSLEIAAGEICGIIGYSGAGKSTLVRLINALEPATSGTIHVDGVDITALGERELRRIRGGIGMIFQQFNLFSAKTVKANIAYPLKLAGWSPREIDERVAELLRFVGLADKARAYPEQLSGGQKQRVGIARALANRPDVLISDEATSALDPQTTGEVLDLLRRVHAEYGITILVVTHEMEVIRDVCNRVAVMQEGRVVEQGSVYEVFAHPQHPTSRRFVSAVLHHLPTTETIRRIRAVHTGRLVQLHIENRESNDPFLSRISRAHDVDVNVVYGGVDEVAPPDAIRLPGHIGDPRRDVLEKAIGDAQAVDISVDNADEP